MGDEQRDDPGYRRETRAERHDRNWNELLQELRVTQTGIQVLFGFLLILPFQGSFPELTGLPRTLYLVVFGLLAVSTACAVTPVIAHRLLFRQKRKKPLVLAGNQFAKASIFTMGLALVGATIMVVDIVVGRGAALAAGGALLALLVVLWIAVPLLVMRRAER